MIQNKYPTIAQIMFDMHNGSNYKDECLEDQDYKAAFKRYCELDKRLTELFVKQNPSKSTLEEFKKCQFDMDLDGHSAILGHAIDYSFAEGFRTCGKLFLEILK